MSYVRWGEDDSDVYVYEDVRGGLMCCGCSLGVFPPGSAPMLDQERFVEHLREHIAAGDVVPGYVIPDVEARTEQHPRLFR
jgi:hypothetical protein